MLSFAIPEGSTARKGAIIFRLSKYNRYSINALASAIEDHPLISSGWVGLLFLNKQKFFEHASELAEGLTGPVVLVYSFMSCEWSDIRAEWKRVRSMPWRGPCIIFCGGPHPTGSVKSVLKEGADFVCAGEGEGAVVSFLDFAFNGSCNLSSSIFFYDQGKLKKGRIADNYPWEDSLPFPRKPYRFGPIEITRGCPFRCAYCETPVIKGTRIRHRTGEVISEAVRVMVAHGRTDVRMISPNALAYGSSDGRRPDVNALYEMLASIRRILPSQGRIFFGSFPSEVRPEFVTEETVEILKEFCNNRTIVVGAQSGSLRMLRAMRRGHGVDEVVKAVELLVEKGFEPAVDFIFGLPGETLEDVNHSLDPAERLAQKGARIHAHAFMPLPGSRWAFAEPTPIPDFARRRLESLISRGKLFGQWMHQDRMRWDQLRCRREGER
ncbi:TIGR04013 family B12-binding domain/radical SAM domain-containing protein [Thermodesulforhabdus norvegica]|uniref:B12-binding domain/radical SAM domain protein, MJ_1487 family n=1 Tax=Thermodesulforhabdus norvegica TaxID=39841 RepID=A0A1I4R0H7_9BACT|nr:TIGR04013 family B12-binding domain/radical SAM domain-containing protein [Thermodesulforhabdus norvegica]SFM45757.1 B12-binding domain/radical SAM domain protein, MJ_1487 family [Thermodesulforhabdus norvegica]